MNSSGTSVNIGGAVNGFFSYTCIMDLIFKGVDLSLILTGVFLLVYLVWGGIEWMTSGGDKTKIESSQKRLTNALIGVAIVASAFAIWKLALTFFGIDAPNICADKPF